MKPNCTPLFAALAFAGLSSTALAQNDDCSGAIPVSLGDTPYDTSSATTGVPTWGCSISGGSDLWYSFTPATTETFIISNCGSSFDTLLQVFDGTCGSLTNIACNDDGCGTSSIVTFAGTAGQLYYFRVGGYNAQIGAGTINIMPFAPPSNDECTGALPIGDGITNTSNLTATDGGPIWSCVVGGRDIWYTFTGSGGPVSIDTCGSSFDTALELYDGTCGALNSIACNDDSCNRQSEVTATTTAGVTYYLRVGGFEGDSGPVSITALGTGSGGTPIGLNYCTANPNSTGAPAAISAIGSDIASFNNATLTASGLPINSFGFFLTSQVQGFVANPGGSAGNLCLGGGIGRYVGNGQIKNSGQSGSFELMLDLTQTPQPNGFVTITSGQTWNFQAWFRDASGGVPTSNFTDGLSATFG